LIFFFYLSLKTTNYNILLELTKIIFILLSISEPEPAEDPLCEVIDPLTMIDVIELPMPEDTSTNTSPAKSDVEQSNIVSSTASGERQFITYPEIRKLPGFNSVSKKKLNAVIKRKYTTSVNYSNILIVIVCY
jgi:hypothetical protein